MLSQPKKKKSVSSRYFQDQNTSLINTTKFTSHHNSFIQTFYTSLLLLRVWPIRYMHSKISKRADKCFTDGNGPDVFVKCAYEWPKPNTELDKKWNTYETLGQGTQCDKSPPPSYYNQLCRAYYDKIKDLE